MIIIKNIYSKIVNFIKNNLKSLIFLIILTFLCWYELPYQIYIPGGIINLSTRVEVEDGYSYTGSLNSSYVSALKGTIPFVLASKIIPDWDLVKNEQVTIENEKLSEAIARDRELLKESLTISQMVALNMANIKYDIVKTHVKILYVYSKSFSNLQVNDEILEIDSAKINNDQEFRNIIREKNKDDAVSIKILRDNKEMTVESRFYEEDGRVLLGVYATTSYDIKTPMKISVKSKSSESGSSGGFMTTLAIYNSLVSKDITKGKKIVGTGTIDLNGNVGEIGGVKYKLMGAVNNKADIFLCPEENYEEAMKIKKEKNYSIDIYAINNIENAIKLLENM